MFDLQLLENNPNTPPFYLTLITILSAFFLSSLLVVTYEFTTKSVYRKPYFLQSLALISIVAATVMQAIGDSVATGLGMLGALSIIRFRTEINDPRNITFMFASLAIGIACGVFGLSIALVGTLAFCLFAIILKYSPLHDPAEIVGSLRVQVPRDTPQQEAIEQKLSACCACFELDSMRLLSPKIEKVVDSEGIEQEQQVREALQEFNYSFRLKEKASIPLLTSQLEEIDGMQGLKISFKNQPAKL